MIHAPSRPNAMNAETSKILKSPVDSKVFIRIGRFGVIIAGEKANPSKIALYISSVYVPLSSRSVKDI